jgi:rhodanese-related sulfurtransferase
LKAGAIRQALILITLGLLPALGEAVYFRNKVSWQSRISASELVTVDQALSWSDHVTWVDARPAEEFEHDHIPGAILLNEDSWNELLPQFLQQWSPEKRVVVYCSAQSCNAAAEVARRLRDEAQLKDNEGKNCVFVLEGGWEEWLKSRR